MTAVKYDIGDELRLSVSFTDITGVAADPTAVTCTVRAPDGTETVLNNTKSTTGSYYADVGPTQSGTYFFRWAGTGALVVAEEGQFYVRERNV